MRAKAWLTTSVVGVAAVGLFILPGGAGGVPSTPYPPGQAQGSTIPLTAASTVAPTVLGTETVAGKGTVAPLPSAAGATTPTVAAVGGPVVGKAVDPSVAAAGENLPSTGSDTGTPIKVAAGFGAAGLAALLLARRRRSTPDTTA